MEMRPGTWDALVTTELTPFRSDFCREFRKKVETGNIQSDKNKQTQFSRDKVFPGTEFKEKFCTCVGSCSSTLSNLVKCGFAKDRMFFR